MSRTHLLSNILVIILLLSVCVNAIYAQNLPQETVVVEGKRYYKYKVQPGEGLYAISRTFSVTVADILRSNPGANSGLQSGQDLLIPVNSANEQQLTNQSTEPSQSSTPSQSSQPTQSSSPLQLPADQNVNFQHTVVRGETVYSISNMYNTSVEEIYKLNPEARETLSINQVLTIPQRRVISEVKEENYRYHTILPKETLYSVSKTYSLKPEDVIAANPGLSVETFQIGKTIRVPFFESYEVILPYEQQTTKITHRVNMGETLYGIGQKYNVSVADIQKENPMLSAGLKVNMELVIPVKSSRLDGVTQKVENEVNQLLTQKTTSQQVDVMKIGLLLPFLDETGGTHLRLQEYYEGFLLAVNEMKNRGVDMELYVFEIGKGNDTKKLESLLETLEIQSLDLVVGGVNDVQIRTISDFSKSRNVKYVVPFSQSNGEVLNNGNIFQVNPLPKSLIDKTSEEFIKLYQNSNIIFISSGQNDKMDLLSQLQVNLRNNNISYETISVTSTLNSSLLSLLNNGRENVIVPTSGDSNSLKRIIQELNEIEETNTDFIIRLFGYPEWQTYTELIPEFHKFGTHIYSSFFVDQTSPDAKAFESNFRKWYGRNMMDTNPGYAMWGYDTGLYFITAMDRYGSNFEQNLHQVRVNSLQFPFHFERLNNWGGFVNTGLYFINYDQNGRIIKTDKSR